MFSSLLLLFFLAVAGTAFGLRDLRRNATLGCRNNTPAFKLKQMYQGEDFLNEWIFESQPDPTRGLVDYQTKEGAVKNGLAYVQKDGTTVLAVDDKTHLADGEHRKSVRIVSKRSFNSGLFIADIWAMPHGCSVWPAYWSVGPDWPRGGEIDILEGVHEAPTNHYTLHTSEGCRTAEPKGRASGKVVSTDCAGINNSGCGFQDGDPRSYGHEFNMIAGGVFAHLWNREGIKVWHFPRGEIPKDITAKKPNPATWGKPVAFWSSSTCDMGKHFTEHRLVINTSLCGDFGNPTYASSGCPGTCADTVKDPANFKWAKWMLNYIAVYDV